MALVCHCRSVNDRVLHTAALATGGDLGATQALCGAGTRCGGCFDVVQAMVAAVQRSPADVAAAVA